MQRKQERTRNKLKFFKAEYAGFNVLKADFEKKITELKTDLSESETKREVLQKELDQLNDQFN